VKTRKMPNYANYYYYLAAAAAAATAIAGILHLISFSNLIGRNPTTGIFFLVAGMAQLFWTIPMVRKWGRIWYYIGIAGTIVLIVLYFITRVPNPITTRALPINSMGMVIEIFQFIYVGITAYIVARQGRIEPKQKEQLR
jgi:peptidoglycan/LPS O-acetylase OafA/YrhL